MKKITCIVLTLALTLTILSGQSIPSVQAEGARYDDTLLLGVYPTEIEVSRIYNRSGYGVIGQPDTMSLEKYGLVDSDGNIVIDPKSSGEYVRHDTFANTFFLSDGILCDYNKAYYKLTEDGPVRMDVFDYSDGETAYEYSRKAMPFYNGKAIVLFTKDEEKEAHSTADEEIILNTEAYQIDTEGHILKKIEPAYPLLTWGGQGYVQTTNFSDHVSYYDYDGNLVISLEGRGYRPFAGAFFEGYAWVIDAETGLVGFIDETGTEVIPCEYQATGIFCDGLAPVKKDDKWGYINAANEVVIPLEYDDAFGAGNGLAAVGIDGKYGLVDYNNQVVIPLEYDDISSFEGGAAYAIKDGKLVIIKPREPLNGWQKIDGAWYYYTDDTALTGWQTIDGKKYYFNADGVMQKSWQKIDGNWYWFAGGGAMATGWKQIGGTYYYFNTEGVMQTGWQKINGTYYYFKTSGAMVTGWQKISGTYYYFKTSGAMATGWQKIDGTYYYLKTSGAMATGWQKINGKYYYFKTSGAMAIGWQQVNGKWYYLNISGAMATGWQKISNKWYYFNTGGDMVTGWKQIGGKWYWFNSSGVMYANGTTTIGGKSYTFDKNGVWVK